MKSLASGLSSTLEHIDQLIKDSELLLKKKRYSASIPLSIIAIEEIGKSNFIESLLRLDEPLTEKLWKEITSGGDEHDKMPPLVITQDNINPIVFDLLQEMWKFEDYEVSNHDPHMFKKKIQKDYSVPNHHGIHDWMESEYAKQFGQSNDGFSHYFEFQDNVYTITMLAVD